MPKVTVPGVGVVSMPDNLSHQELLDRAYDMKMAAAQSAEPKFNPKDLGIGQLISGGIHRSWEGLKGDVMEGLPALGASALGYKDTAKSLLDQYQERMQTAEAESPAAYKSYKNIQGPSDILPFLAESTGELVPTAASFIGGAGIGTQIGKQVAKRGLATAIEKNLAEHITKRGLTEEAGAALQDRITKQAIRKGAEVGSKTGLWGSSVATNVPDTFQQIYEDTGGELHPGVALTIGPLVAALDTYLPGKMLKQLGPAGKKQLAAQLLEKSEVVPTTWKKAFIGEALKTAGGESLTEGGQQVLQVLGSQIAGDKQPFFSQKNVDSIITSALKGAVGGITLGAPGAAVEARNIKNLSKQRADELKAQQEQQANISPANPQLGFTPPPEGYQPDMFPVEKAQAEQAQAQQQATQDAYRPDFELGQQMPAAPVQEQAQPSTQGEFDFNAPQEQGQLDLVGARTAPQMAIEKVVAEKNQAEMDKLQQQREAAIEKAHTAKILLDEAIAESDARVEAGEIKRREAARLDLLHPVLENTSIQDTTKAFQGNLKRAGYSSLELTAHEKELIAKADDVKAALAEGIVAPPVEEEAAAPNELTPESTGIKEKGEKGPAGIPGQKQPTLFGNQPQLQEAPVEESAPEVTPSTVLDAELLAGTGLPKQSGFYRQLLNKDMADPAQQVAIGQTIATIRNNPNISPATKQAVESIAMQAFNALATQQEMFGPKGGVLKGAENGPIQRKPVSKTNRASVSVPSEKVSAPTERARAPKQSGVGSSRVSTRKPTVRTETKHNTLNETSSKTEATKPNVQATTTTKAEEPSVGQNTQYARALKKHLENLNDRLRNETDPYEKETLRDEIRDLRTELSDMDPKFREHAGKVAGMSVKDVQGTIRQITEGWVNAPKIVVVQSITDLGPKLAAHLKESGNEFAPGFYDPKSQHVIVIADNIEDVPDLIKTVAHETTGHFGLQAILGDKYSQVMGEIYAGNKMVRELADAKLKTNPELGKDLATEEVLADMQESGGPEIKQLKGIAKLYNMIRNFLKRIGLPHVSNEDVAKLLADARSYVIEGGKPPPPGTKALEQRSGLVFRNPTFRKNGTAGVTANDAKAVFDSFTDWIEDAGILSPEKADSLHEFLKNGIAGNARKAALWCLPVRPLTEEAVRAGLPMAPEFNNIIDEHSGYVNKLNQSIEPLVKKAEDWSKNVSQKMRDAFNDVVYDSTISRIDPTKAKKEDTTQADYDRIVDKYKKLDPIGKQLYQQIRDAYRATYNEILASIEDRINTFVTDPKAKEQIKADILEKLAKQGSIDPYFALTRKGKYWLAYNMKDKAGQLETYMEAYETERERNKQEAMLIKEGAADIQKFTQVSQYKYSRAPSGSFVNKMLNILEVNKPKDLSEEESKRYDESADEVMRLYLSTLPETSFAQSFQKRKDVLGFRRDAIEAMRDRLYNTAQQLGRMRYSAKLNKLLEDMRDYSKAASRGANGDPVNNQLINDYISVFEKHAQSITNPQISKISTVINSIGFNYLLGFNISSAVVNMAQVPMIVAPYLAGEHTWGQTMGAINNAYKTYLDSGFGKDVRSTKMIGGEEMVKQRGMPSITNYAAEHEMGKRYGTLIEEGQKRGQFNRSQFYDTLEVDGRKNWGSTLNAASGFAFHHGERMNREVSMMAAYDLQLAKLKKQGKTGKEAEIAAADYALYVTEMTNGGISASSAPLIAKNSLGKVLFMFKRYGVSMYYMLFKVTRDALKGQTPEIRKAAMSQIAGVYGTSALFAGLQGIPMFGLAAMVYNLFADDDEDDFETATRKYTGEFAYKGMLNYLTGAEVASRFSLSDLVFRSNPASSSSTFEKGLLETFGGPAYGVGSRVMRGLQFMNEGNMQRGVENVLPSSIGNMMKAYRFGTEGAKNLRGDPITEDISALSVAAQALGFAPAEYTRQLEINSKLKGIEKAVLDKKTKLLQQWNISNAQGDHEDATKYKQKLKDLNAKHPALGITEDTFAKSKTMFHDASKRSVNGVVFSKKMYSEMMQNASEYEQ